MLSSGMTGLEVLVNSIFIALPNALNANQVTQNHTILLSVISVRPYRSIAVARPMAKKRGMLVNTDFTVEDTASSFMLLRLLSANAAEHTPEQIKASPKICLT